MKTSHSKGYHSQEALEAFSKAWDDESLVLFIPPSQSNFELKIDLKDLKEKPVCGVFTSGSTQTPRLVLYSKDNLEASIRGIYSLYDNSRVEKILCYPQPYHTFGVTLGYAAHKILGIPIEFIEGAYSRKSHEHWLKNVTDKTITLGTPTHFFDLISHCEDNQITPQKSYSAIIGGAKVKRQLWLDLKKKLNVEQPSIGYGATEASPGVCHLAPGIEPQEDGEIGQPLKHVKTKILASGLQFSGPNLCTAIIEQGQLLKPESFILPDIVRVREDGTWIYQTRANWFLNRGGEKFSLEKLEKDIYENLNIEALCLSLPSERLGEDLGILVKTKSIDEVKPKIYELLKSKTLRDFNSENCLAVEEFPLTATHKWDRRKAIDIFKQN